VSPQQAKADYQWGFKVAVDHLNDAVVRFVSRQEGSSNAWLRDGDLYRRSGVAFIRQVPQ
jgi:hypothetical protein